MDARGIEPARQRVQEIGAMERVVRRAKARRGGPAVVEFEELAGLHVARVGAGRGVADGGDLVAEPDRAQRLHRLRTGVDAGADLAQGGRRLENLRRKAECGERVRRGEPRKPAADDRDAASLPLPHARLPLLPWRPRRGNIT